MEFSPLWDLGLNGTGVIVGVADSGIELDHGCPVIMKPRLARLE